jgi:hypothetical protein
MPRTSRCSSSASPRIEPDLARQPFGIAVGPIAQDLHPQHFSRATARQAGGQRLEISHGLRIHGHDHVTAADTGLVGGRSRLHSPDLARPPQRQRGDTEFPSLAHVDPRVGQPFRQGCRLGRTRPGAEEIQPLQGAQPPQQVERRGIERHTAHAQYRESAQPRQQGQVAGSALPVGTQVDFQSAPLDRRPLADHGSQRFQSLPCRGGGAHRVKLER